MRSILNNLFRTWRGTAVGSLDDASAVAEETRRSPYGVEVDMLLENDRDNVYPPEGRRYPIVDIEWMMESQDTLVQRIVTHYGGRPEMHDKYIYPVLENYARFVHLLPASENHHHSGKGGLWAHALEVASLALMRCVAEESLSGYDIDPSKKDLREKQWRYAVFLGSLLHDVGKVISDIKVSSPEEKNWIPIAEPLYNWAVREGIQYYYAVPKRGRRHKRHERHVERLMSKIVPDACLEFLYIDVDELIYEELIDALTLQDGTSRLTDILQWADSESVKQDLRLSNRKDRHNNVKLPVTYYMSKAMSEAVEDGSWQVNLPGARVYASREDDVFVFWDAASQDIRTRLKMWGVDGVPGNPDTMANMLIERNMAEAFIDMQNNSHIYWMVQPKNTNQAFRCIKLANDMEVLKNHEYKKMDVHVLTDERAAVIQQAPPTENIEEAKQTEITQTSDPKQLDPEEEAKYPVKSTKAAKTKSAQAAVKPVDSKAVQDANHVVEAAGQSSGIIKSLLEDCISGKHKQGKDWFVHDNAFCLKYPECIDGYGIPQADVAAKLKQLDLLKLDPSRPMVPVITITHNNQQVVVLRLNEELSKAFIALVDTQNLHNTTEKSIRPQRETELITAKHNGADNTKKSGGEIEKTSVLVDVPKNTKTRDHARIREESKNHHAKKKLVLKSLIEALSRAYHDNELSCSTESDFIVITTEEIREWTKDNDDLDVKIRRGIWGVLGASNNLGIKQDGSKYYIPRRIMERG